MGDQPWTSAVRSRDDVQLLIDDVNRRGLARATVTALAEAVRPADDTTPTPDASRLLPAPEALHGLLPWPGGLRKGATVAVTGSRSISRGGDMSFMSSTICAVSSDSRRPTAASVTA